ncbi:hypothetical protein BS47DRAFT_1377112 [Hydnum rufescens UP504]|uniref:Ribosomal RNA-processing protein 42 n=1 Tax=Hydnum rufescens UP504 TaxID=1448309 RepID=A0A9P6DUH0_9AGAM|nr:hypothetical protein BS47DRAFT_1377112 [Hydnum rufescens UP504]
MVISKSEQSYIRSSLLAGDSHRADGRGLDRFRTISLQAGGDVAPLANGSARVNIGGSEVIAAVKLEGPSGDDEALGRNGGRISCTITCSQSAYPYKTNSQLDETSSDLTSIISSALSSSITPSPQLTIVPNKKSWLLNVDALVLSDAGNILDALFISIRGALWDLKIPRTRGIQFTSREPGDLEGEADIMKGVLRERKQIDAVDFELEDFWEDGDPLVNRDSLPIAISLNILHPIYFLDACLAEEESAPDRLVLFFSFPSPAKSARYSSGGVAPGTLHGIHLMGPGELPYTRLMPLIAQGEKHARELCVALNSMLRGEDAKINAQTTIRR